MRSQALRKSRILFAFLVASSVAACGGGSAPAAGPVPPPPSTISGVVMLGPVASADVEISGTGGVLGSGTTAADGSFGPINYSNTYSGPLRITVTGNVGSTWICDFMIGCLSNNVIMPPGSSIAFDGRLEAVLPDATSGQFISVSMLSNFVASRTDVLGGLTAANINVAFSDIADTIRSVLGDVFSDLSLVLPDVFARIELFDFRNVPTSGGGDDALSVFLTLFNSGLMGLASPIQSTGEFIDQITVAIANQPVLSVSNPNFTNPSMESFLAMFLVQVGETFDAGGPLAASIDSLLSPDNLNDVLNSLALTFFSMPALDLGIFELNILADDVALQGSIFREYHVTTNTGEQLQLSDFGVDDVEFGAGNWMSASTVLIGGDPHVRIDMNNAVIAAMANGTYDGFVEVYSNTGEFRRHSVLVMLTVQIAGN